MKKALRKRRKNPRKVWHSRSSTGMSYVIMWTLSALFTKLLSWLNFRIPGYLFTKGGNVKCRLRTDCGLLVFRVRKQWDCCCHVLICMVKTIVRIRVLHGLITRAVNPPRHQILRIDREGIIDDVISHDKWCHFVSKNARWSWSTYIAHKQFVLSHIIA